MTGAFVRIKRDDKWQPVEIEKLSDLERAEFFNVQNNNSLLRWIDFLSNWITTNVTESKQGEIKDGKRTQERS